MCNVWGILVGILFLGLFFGFVCMISKVLERA
jgi:hypothetical protein